MSTTPTKLRPCSLGKSGFAKAMTEEFWEKWANSSMPEPRVAGVFEVIRGPDDRVRRKYKDYRDSRGNREMMWHGTKRACNIGDDRNQRYLCDREDCSVCAILQTTIDPKRASSKSMFGAAAYLTPNSSKAANPRYMRNKDPGSSPYVVLILCAVALGRPYYAKRPMNGATGPPKGYDCIYGTAGYTSQGTGRGTKLNYDEVAIFDKYATLPMGIIVLEFPPGTGYSTVQTRYPQQVTSSTPGLSTRITARVVGGVLHGTAPPGFSFRGCEKYLPTIVVSDASGNKKELPNRIQVPRGAGRQEHIGLSISEAFLKQWWCLLPSVQ